MSAIAVRSASHPYEVRIGAGALRELGARLRAVAPAARAAVVADARIAGSLGAIVERSLRDAGYEVALRSLAGGEAGKTLDEVRALYGWLIDHRLERGQPIVALGGGVIGDTVGFAAASYLRGVPLVHCPTTLVAMTDSCIGGKVGVNLPQGKNLVGAFHPPVLVVIDVDALGSLPDRELRCGLAECVGHAVIGDAALFDWIERRLADLMQRRPDALEELIRRNVAIKARIVMADEREHGMRALLNLGHTFGHAIEASLDYQHYQHGEAVALGLIAAARTAQSIGHCGAEVAPRIEALLAAIGLPTGSDALPPTPVLMAAMRRDKKRAGDQLRLVLPREIGDVSLEAGVPDAAIAAAWDGLRTRTRRNPALRTRG
ncbi:MAG TPA: 3-dehydroquinate synthase [Kofleriaceae bacterium]|nr:3-dehydroquinate synthase [Kofleriaceae bacterium]